MTHDLVALRWSVDPYERVGPVPLGAPAESIRAAVPYDRRTAKKSPWSREIVDTFPAVGVSIRYDSSDRSEAVRFEGVIQPMLGEIALLGQPFDEVYAALKEVDPRVQIDSSGCTSTALGVTLYAPNLHREDSAPVREVLVFVRGYYESGS
jgi:hypothetical protein